MPTIEFFTPFGFLHARSFLDPGVCERLRDEIRNATGTAATILRAGAREVDERVRKVTGTDVSAGAQALVAERLTAIKPDLERHFGVALSGYEEPSFLRYRAGDFYVAHRDLLDDPADAAWLRARRVSVVVFLNRQGEPSDPAAYGGGALTFAGLLEDERLRRFGIPLVAEPGLLVAFRSDLLHSVTPVTHGERYTIVTWFS
jgi:predicted 2-oxoglutarate/Fe(II)-dependent dioxygenase YbiX